ARGRRLLHSFPTRRSSDLTYYFWVRSVCSGTTNSEWNLINGSFLTLCQPPAITATTTAYVCNSSATFTAITDAGATVSWFTDARSEEHTSELQSRENLVCR